MEQHVETAHAFFEAYHRHDTDAMLALCAADATFNYYPYGEQGQGAMTQAAGAWKMFIDAFPDFSVQIQKIMQTTDGAVIVQSVQGGTQAQEVMGIANKGRAQYAPHIFVVHFDEAGKIRHLEGYWDNNTIYYQLGHTEQHD